MRHVVEIAEVRIARAPDILVSIGLGSCIAIALYDNDRKIGGMSHALLPACNGFSTEPKKFVDKSIIYLLELMESAGARRKNITARLVGGASIFPELNEIQCIGEKNIMSARQVLSKLGIVVVGEDVGGNQGRSVEFYIASGEVIVKTEQRIKCVL